MAAKTAIKKSFIPNFPPHMKANNSDLTLKEAYDNLISITTKNGEKGCIQKEELADTLLKSAEKGFTLTAYDGFEPSGRMHIAQGLMKTINVNKMTKSGIKFTFLIADWFAHLNNKFNGDLQKIRKVGQYFIEVWKSCGMDLTNVTFLWSSQEINKSPEEYWTIVMDIARKNSITRIKRCGQIMGRKIHSPPPINLPLLSKIYSQRSNDSTLSEKDFIQKYTAENQNSSSLNSPLIFNDPSPVSSLLYPLMQCADIFLLKANICQLGFDQLKVNMLAREYCDALKKTKKNLPKIFGSSPPRKPIVLSHPMLMGLKENQKKMSKSDLNSAIFMEDSEEEVTRKLRKAFCRPGDIVNNPVLDYLENIVFPWYGSFGEDEYEFVVERSEENGGDLVYGEFGELREDFSKCVIHPSDLKRSVGVELNKLLEPVRKHFESGSACELLEEIKMMR